MAVLLLLVSGVVAIHPSPGSHSSCATRYSLDILLGGGPLAANTLSRHCNTLFHERGGFNVLEIVQEVLPPPPRVKFFL